MVAHNNPNTIRECPDSEIERVWRLTHDVYVSQGYADPRPDGLLVHYKHLDCIPETTVLIAEDERGEIVATVSLTEDKPYGLHVDIDFEREIQAVRNLLSGPICASWRIVSRDDARAAFGTILRLMKEIADRVDDTENLLIDCHPKHERFYRKFWGFQRLAGPRRIESAKGAPAVLLLATGATLRRAWESRGRKLGQRIAEA